MPLNLSVFLNKERTREVLARKQREEVVGEKRSSFAAPVYLMIDRSVELLALERRELAGVFTENQWRLLLDVLRDCDKVEEMEVMVMDAIVFQGKLEEHGVAHGAGDDSELTTKLSMEKFSYSQKWAVLDIIERFYSAGDIIADAEGLKKLGILCKE